MLYLEYYNFKLPVIFQWLIFEYTYHIYSFRIECYSPYIFLNYCIVKKMIDQKIFSLVSMTHDSG